jgi:HSP20 family molecular chaperone IbpA
VQSAFDEIKEMRDRIMQRAYDIFQSKGSIFGQDLQNWLQAEHELTWKPAIALREKDGHFEILAALAGVEAKDLDIEVTPEDVILKADVDHRHTEDKGTVYICEFEGGRLFRAIHLPKKIDPDKVKAEFRNGMLLLTAAIVEAGGETITVEAA